MVGRSRSARLLDHTSGIRDYRGLLNLAGHRNDEIVRAPRILQILALQRGLSFPMGQQTMYSNSGYFLAGLIIERLSGMSFQRFMRIRFFEPLDMKHTRFKGDTDGLPNLARHHAPSGDGGFESSYERWEDYGPGDLYSTIEDLARWDAHFRSPRLSGHQLVRSLESRASLNDGREAEYGLGLRHGTMHGRRIIGHTGASEGSASTYQRFPDLGLSIVALCARTDGPADALASEIAAHLLPAGPGAAPPSYLAEYAGLPNSPQEAWAGTYHGIGNPSIIRVRPEGASLKLDMAGRIFSLEPFGGDVYQVVGAPTDTYARFVPATGSQPRKLVPLDSEDSPMLAFDQATPTTGALLALAGEYDCPEFDARIRLRAEEGRLVADIPPEKGQAMQPLGERQFVLERLVFTFDPPVTGASPGFRLDQWRARGMRCERRGLTKPQQSSASPQARTLLSLSSRG